jgi:osmotically inducible protein OsmC
MTSHKAEAIYEAQAHWEGGLSDGNGRLAGSKSGQIPDLPMTWGARTGHDYKMTSPEELLAAAHAACFSMALAAELQGRKAPPRSLDVSARVGFDPKVGGGYQVSFSELKVKGEVPGISAEDFQEAVRQAGEGCPISQALKGNVEISAEGELV